MANLIPIRVVVSSIMVVEKGDYVIRKLGKGDQTGVGFARMEVEEDGIYLGPEQPILTITDLEDSIKELKRLRRKRQREKDTLLEERYNLRLI